MFERIHRPAERIARRELSHDRTERRREPRAQLAEAFGETFVVEVFGIEQRGR